MRSDVAARSRRAARQVRPRGLRLRGWAIVVLVVTLAACSEPEATEQSGPVELAALEGPLTIAASEAIVDLDAIGVEADRAMQQKWIECMLAEGFELSTLDAPALPPERSLDGISEQEFARTYGFGISTIGASLDEQQATGAAGVYAHARSELDPAKRIAYEEAFFDSSQLPFMSDYNTDPGVANVDPASCLGQGLDHRQDVLETQHPDRAELERLVDAAGQVRAAFDADEDTLALYEDYVVCMTEAGYAIEQPSPTGAILVAAGWFDDFQRSQHRGDVDREALADVQQKEVELAVSSLDCQAPLRAELADSYAAFESEWLLARPELAPLLAERTD